MITATGQQVTGASYERDVFIGIDNASYQVPDLPIGFDKTTVRMVIKGASDYGDFRSNSNNNPDSLDNCSYLGIENW